LCVVYLVGEEERGAWNWLWFRDGVKGPIFRTCHMSRAPREKTGGSAVVRGKGDPLHAVRLELDANRSVRKLYSTHQTERTQVEKNIGKRKVTQQKSGTRAKGRRETDNSENHPSRELPGKLYGKGGSICAKREWTSGPCYGGGGTHRSPLENSHGRPSRKKQEKGRKRESEKKGEQIDTASAPFSGRRRGKIKPL